MRQILKQSFWLFLAQILSKAISLFYIYYLARVLGVGGFGLYTVALAYFAIISSIADFGFNRYLIREVAKERQQARELLSSVLMLRLTLTSVLFAVFAVFLYSLDPDKIRVSLILLAALAILPQTIAFTFDGIFVAIRKLQFSAVALFLHSLLIAVLGVVLIKAGYGVAGAVIALILGQLGYAVLLAILLAKVEGLNFSAVRLHIIKQALTGSLPYGLLGVLGLIYFRIDTIMLSYLKGSFETGIYGAGYKFLEAVILIPGAFSSALFPALAKLHEVDKKEMKRIYFKSLKLMGVIGLVVLIGYITILPQVIKMFLPDYLQAIGVVSILALSVPFIFLAAPGVQVMFSSEKYLKSVIFLSFFTVMFNIVLNFIFIPRFGFIAAAWTTVASDVLSFAVFYIFIVRKIFKYET